MSMKVVFLSLCVALAFLSVGCGRSKPASSKAATTEAVTAEDAAAPPSTPAPQSVPASASTTPVAVPPPPQPISFGLLPPGRDPAGDAALQARQNRAKNLAEVQHQGEQKGGQSQVQPEGNDGQ